MQKFSIDPKVYQTCSSLVPKLKKSQQCWWLKIVGMKGTNDGGST